MTASPPLRSLVLRFRSVAVRDGGEPTNAEIVLTRAFASSRPFELESVAFETCFVFFEVMVLDISFLPARPRGTVSALCEHRGDVVSNRHEHNARGRRRGPYG